MGSLLPGWESSNPVAIGDHHEEVDEHAPWWINRKEYMEVKDTEARLSRTHGDTFSLARDSAERRHSYDRRHSYERRRSLEATRVESEESDVEKEEGGEVDEGGKVRLFWWKRMVSSSLNEKPDTAPDQYKKGSYVPQFDIAGENQYSVQASSKEASPPVIVLDYKKILG
eukprot:TRINITY_DN3743_c0_g1_i3.p1 TRINITY_DN3743_c0_g1~~TRINITY_DN3743_c0_g1_i3.p1  ORF type:complete len:170 (-),score=44.24 TRINITY_DN3743_c0_g1_i3:310-819(-)